MWSKIIEFSLKYKLLVIVVAIAVTILGWQTFQSAARDLGSENSRARSIEDGQGIDTNNRDL